MDEPLLRVKDIVKLFPVYERGILTRRKVGEVHAVDQISLTIDKGETLGLVGESGCGKTTAGKVILDLIPKDSGEVFFEHKDVHATLVNGSREDARYIRRNLQMVFQNPYGSLDPRMTVFAIVSEAFIVHQQLSKKEWADRAYQLLKLVCLEEYHAERYPHEFSGGHRQRISFARALATEPKFIVADEPVSSLDVSVRAQILTLLQSLQQQETISFLYISHDLSSVRQISQHVIVMYLGKIMEYADVDRIFEHPLNPYTVALLSAVPVPDPERKIKKILLAGDVPSPINPPSGCRFNPRCPYATDICKQTEPPLRQLESGHLVACHHAEKLM